MDEPRQRLLDGVIDEALQRHLVGWQRVPHAGGLRRVLASLKALCADVNDAPRELDNAQVMHSVYKRVEPQLDRLIAPHRRFDVPQRVRRYR